MLYICLNFFLFFLLFMRFFMFLKFKKINLDIFFCIMCYFNFKNKLKVIVIYMYSLLIYLINLY